MRNKGERYERRYTVRGVTYAQSHTRPAAEVASQVSYAKCRSPASCWHFF